MGRRLDGGHVMGRGKMISTCVDRSRSGGWGGGLCQARRLAYGGGKAHLKSSVRAGFGRAGKFPPFDG